MSSDPPSGGPSHPPDRAPALATEPGQAAVVAALGGALIDAVEQHLPGARAHAESTGGYAFTLAVALDHDRERSELIREAAKLHDVGMVYVPVSTLRKPTAELDDADRALLASHIEAGARLALGAGIPEHVCGWILATRERWDGAGPERLREDAIPIESRIIRAACAADLMLATAGAVGTVAGLRAAAGTELDPRVVDALAGVLERVAPRP